MNSETFVSIVDTVVCKSAISGVLKQLAKPSGRQPAQTLVEMSAWYNNLDDGQKKIVSNVITMSARHAVANFLGVLDGLIAIEGENKGTLKLYYERNHERVLLNDQENLNLQEFFI